MYFSKFAAKCSISADNEFGPFVRCSSFDFTLKFEQLILEIGISTIFLLLVPLRLRELYGASIKTLPSVVQIGKLAFSILLLCTQIAFFVLWTLMPLTDVSILAAVIQVMSNIAIIALVILEHRRTVRPSYLLCLYLLSSLVVSGIEMRTILLRKYAVLTAHLHSVTLASKLALLILELLPKPLYPKYRDDYSPEELASVFSDIFLWWINPIFRTGSRKILEMSDIYPLPHELRSNSSRTRFDKIWLQAKKKGSYGLILTLFSLSKWRLFETLPIQAASIFFKYAQIYIISEAIEYLDTPSLSRNPSKPPRLIICSAIVYFGNAISFNVFNQRFTRMSIVLRSAMSSAIYAKTLSATSTQADLAPVTLMSTDAEKVIDAFMSSCNIWAHVIEIFIGIWLLWIKLGAVSVAPTLIAVACFILQARVSQYLSPRQGKWMEAVQRRVGIASTVVRSMKSVKLAGLVGSMISLLDAEREREVEYAKRFRWLYVGINMISNFPSVFCALIVFAVYSIEAYVKHAPPLTAAKAFSAFVIIGLLTTPVIQLLVVIPKVWEAGGSVDRIQEFLSSSDFDDKRVMIENGNLPADSADADINGELLDSAYIAVSKLILRESTESSGTSNPITFTGNRGTTTMIIGPVGCGKSTFLKHLLGEASVQSGTIAVRSPFVAYCSQTPWLQNSTIREVIIGPKDYDEVWYKKSISICALEQDLAQMPLGDMTAVGSKGLKISGGQKQRIALARALYSRCQILVLDDFLSGLDERTRDTVTKKLFTEEGHIRQHGCTVILATHSTNHLSLADNLIVLDKNGFMDYYGPPRNWTGFQDYFMQYAQSPVAERSSLDSLLKNDQNGSLSTSKDNKTSEEEDNKRQTGDLTDWLYYGKAIGIRLILGVLLTTITASFMMNFQKLWLKLGTENQHISVGLFICVYTFSSVVAAICMALTIGYMMLIVAPTSAIKLHQTLVRATLRAPISLFESVDSSILINRFSQDMNLVDFALPAAIFMLVIGIIYAMIDMVFLCFGSTYMGVVVPVTLFTFYWIQRYYLRTSRQLRLLELEAKSPLYQHFTETIEGVLTIRALGWEIFFDNMALAKVDEALKSMYLLLCAQRWLSIVLKLSGATLGVIVVALAVLLPDSSSGGSLGVALVSVMTFNESVSQMLNQWTQSEMLLGAVNRTRTFERDTPCEDSPEDTYDPGEAWPVGAIGVSDLNVTYQDGTVGLKDVSFNIGYGQKIGIAGRTGSGKSTLLSCFLRLIDPNDGRITIDGINIGNVPRNIVRDKLICLPQDALIFIGTFRFNLDTQNHVSSDDDIIDALKLVGLWLLVEERGGLSAEVHPDALSHGEQQLLAITRAVLRKRVAKGRSILILDEATSNIDAATQEVVQKVIETEFKDNTVITVAHRLETIKDSDMVIILNNGRISKMGPPSEVL